MSSRYYPLYQKGNPQLRVFLPNFWMKLIRPEEPKPRNVVVFRTSVRMTEHDVKNYLEKIYKIPVVEAKVEIKMGEIRKAPEKGYLIKDPDYKEAVVTLPRDVTFDFPDCAVEPISQKEKKEFQDQRKKHKETLEKNKHRPGLPGWFSL